VLYEWKKETNTYLFAMITLCVGNKYKTYIGLRLYWLQVYNIHEYYIILFVKDYIFIFLIGYTCGFVHLYLFCKQQLPKKACKA